MISHFFSNFIFSTVYIVERDAYPYGLLIRMERVRHEEKGWTTCFSLFFSSYVCREGRERVAPCCQNTLIIRNGGPLRTPQTPWCWEQCSEGYLSGLNSPQDVVGLVVPGWRKSFQGLLINKVFFSASTDLGIYHKTCPEDLSSLFHFPFFDKVVDILCWSR